MAADKTIQALIAQIEKSIGDFQHGVPGIQQRVFESLIEQVKGLSLQNGKVLNSVENLRLIAGIKNKIERLIISEGYKQSVKEYIKAFDTIEALSVQYFSAFNKQFTPNKTLPIIKEAAVDATLNGLLGQGLQANVVDKLTKILSDNITTGGSYSSLAEQLRNAVLTNETGEGLIERYSKTITTDALNQYAAQYQDIVAQDLKFNWCRYVGSNITTTREFCDWLTRKEWIHRSELPEILTGLIDGHQCKVNKQGLPLGMIPGTTVDNFKIRRGGYNCGHQAFWVPDSAVPAYIRARIGKPQPQDEPVKDVADKVLTANKAEIGKIEKKGISLHPDLINQVGDETLKIVVGGTQGAYYSPSDNKIVIGKNPTRETSEYYKQTVLAHELAHALHRKKDIITSVKISPEFKDHFDALKQIVAGKEASVNEALMKKVFDEKLSIDDQEQLGVVFDILGSLTDGKYGGGHSTSYYRKHNGAEKEIFVHGVTLLRTDNKYSDITTEMKEIVELMKQYASKVMQ
jgi:hypothetical protein